MPGLTSLLTQGLHGIGHILRLVYVCIAKRRRPRQVLVHVFKNRRELRQGLYARIPVLFVDFFGELVTLEIGMTLHPALRLDNLSWIRGSGENLRNERVRVQGDRRDKLLQFLRGLFRRRSLRLAGLARRTVGAGLRCELHKQTAEKYGQNLL